MEHEHELSFEQAAVVSFGAGSGHMLVLARPGSGKTHTLAARAKRLLNDGAEPRQMLAMTFSNRAANHLKDRLPAGGIWAGTFHAVCADILEQFGSVIGVRWPFRILDEVRAREFLLRAITELGVPLPHDDGWRERCLRELTEGIERRKNQGLERVDGAVGGQLGHDVAARIDETYCRLLTDANALDFADLIANAVRVLEQDEPTAEALRNRLRHLFIDEIHDISPEQYHLMGLLAPPRSSCQVFGVGDPDQAIYGWRGADARKMLARYRSDYQPTVHNLTRNFRSLAPIVRAADALMKNAGRTQRSTPNRVGRARPIWWGYATEQIEAREVAASIARAMRSGEFAGYGDFAVLYRTHAIGNAVEAELLHAGIPICRVQRERFFHDPDAQESLRYLELAFGLHDAGFEPALSWPRVIVDEMTMVHLQRLAERRELRLSELVREIDDLGDDVSPLTRGTIREFLATIGRDLGPLSGLPIAKVLEPFLEALKRRRSPIPRAERELVRDTLDLLEPSLREAQAALDVAIGAGRPVVVHALPGADNAAAAIVARHALDWYFGLAAEEVRAAPASSTAFVLTLGADHPCTPNGIGLGPLHSRTVSFSVATRTWRLMQMVLMGRETVDQGACVLLDVETSNHHPERAELLEFGAVRFEAGAVTGPGITSLVRPSAPGVIDPGATDVHGLRWSDVAEAPEPAAALPALLQALDGKVVVGHNIERFDLPVLRRAAAGAGLSFRPTHAIDTCRLAERLWPGEASYRLEDLARRTDPTAIQRHRAYDDCLLTGHVFAALLLASRREREIDVLSECLPVVAASIVAGKYDVANDNALLVAIGARSLAAGLGEKPFLDWEQHVDRVAETGARSQLESTAIAASDEDEAWERLVRGWRMTVDAFCASEPDQGIGRFLHFAALAQPLDALPKRVHAGDGNDPRSLGPDQRVALMTVHSAKGLEWPVVMLVGVEDDQYPHYNTKTEEQLAEERRLLYVGMTRAEDWLLMFSARERNGWRKGRSRFLEELIGDTIDVWQPGRGSSGAA